MATNYSWKSRRYEDHLDRHGRLQVRNEYTIGCARPKNVSKRMAILFLVYAINDNTELEFSWVFGGQFLDF
jgi:hypothetical protein